MESAINVARYLLELAKGDDESQPLTPMHIHKLLYLAQGWHLAVRGEPLFHDRIEAWRHGPVIPEVNRHYSGSAAPVEDPTPCRPLEDEAAEIVRQVWRRYQSKSAIGLRDITHRNPPWIDAWADRELPNHGSEEIKQGVMAEFFRKKLRETHGPLTKSAVEKSLQQIADGDCIDLEDLKAEFSE